MTTEKFQKQYSIPSARARWHDYNDGVYFITVCTAHRKHYFGEIMQGEIILNALGTELHKIVTETPIHNSYAQIPVFQVMPNHIHLIVCIDNVAGGNANRTDAVDCRDAVDCTDAVDCRDAACHVSTEAACHVSTGEKMRIIALNCGRLSTVVGGIKSATTKYANQNKITFKWQERFHDRIIRDAIEYERIANYIQNNPNTWTDDEFNV